MKRRGLHPVMVALLLILALVAVSRPWVVVPIGARGDAPGNASTSSIEERAAKIWTADVPDHVAAAVPLVAVTSKPGFVRGEGLVASIQSGSRVGVAYIDATVENRIVKVAMSIGPVIRGNLLRDALGLGFEDFSSQSDFANISARLNQRALAGLNLADTPQALRGRKVTFTGAASANADGSVDLVPVQLVVAP